MKITHHIPQEEYGYTEIEYEDNTPGLHTEKTQKALDEYPKPIDGLDTHDWVKLRDGYFVAQEMNPELQELLEQCSSEQRSHINQIKLAIKNTKTK